MLHPSGQLSDEIAIDNGVKQGDIYEPTLFSIYFAVMHSYAFREGNIRINIYIRTTRKVFSLRFNARANAFQTHVRELLYADDVDSVAHTERHM